MKSERTQPAVEPSAPSGGWWTRFWFSPSDPISLHVVRIAAGLLFIFWLLPFAGNLGPFFSLQGYLDRQGYLEAAALPEDSTIPIGWSLLYLCTSKTSLTVFYWSSLAVLVLFTLGLAPRVTGTLTWVIVISFLVNPATYYPADFLLGILALYLMIGYVLLGQWNRPQTFLGRVLGNKDTFVLRRLFENNQTEEAPRASIGAQVAIRLLQVHFALILVVGALHKLQMGDWWAGVAYWYPLHSPFQISPEAMRAKVDNSATLLFFLSLAQYLFVAWQLGIPFFAWRRGWFCRSILLGGAIYSWLIFFFLFQQPLFGPIFLIAALTFITPAEWRRLAGTIAGRLGGMFSNVGDKKVTMPTRGMKHLVHQSAR